MSKFWVIFKREYAQVVKKKSFVVGIVLTPLLMAGFMVLPAFLATRKASEPQPMVVVDQSQQNLGERFSTALADYELDDGRPYYEIQDVITVSPDDDNGMQAVQDSLNTAINDKSIKYYVVFKPEAHHYPSDSVFMVSNTDNLRTQKRFENEISHMLSSLRLGESEINLPVDSVLALTRQVDLTIRDAKGESIPFLVKYLSALVFVGIMMGMILGYGQQVMRSVIDEKNSRIMEVLVSSVSPFQLMLGKVLGLGAATMTQVAIWVAMGLGLYALRGTLAMDEAVSRIVFNPAIVIYFVLYLVSGYILFSTIFALLGSVVTSEKEAQNIVAPITIILVLPFVLAMHVIQEPNSTLSVVLSFFPLLTPTLMQMRVAFVAPTLTDYSIFSGMIGQAALGFIVVCVTSVVLIWLTSRIFRVGILMYGKRATLPEIMRWLRYK
jgi:ABC-2 type transport system permease protein